MFDINKLEDYIDYLVTIAENIDYTGVTVLTGGNAKGKSLIRKTINSVLMDKLNKRKVIVPHASQEVRTSSYASLGAMSSFAADMNWLATSYNTINIIQKTLAVKGADYFVIDEPEIGLGEELQLGLVDYLNKTLPTLNTGCLIICHSRLMVKHLKHDNFVNLEGMSENQWVNRIPVKLTLEDFEKESSALFEAVRDRLNKK